MNKEIEVKVKLTSYLQAKQILDKKLTLKKRVVQIDEYWTPAHKHIYNTKPREYLRVRQEGNETRLEYHPKSVLNKKGEKLYSPEYETPVSDGNMLRKILQLLDCKKIIVIKKHRSYYENEDLIFCLDKVEGLGAFLEVEAKKVIKNYKHTFELCQENIDLLGIAYAKEKQKNYFSQLYKK